MQKTFIAHLHCLNIIGVIDGQTISNRQLKGKTIFCLKETDDVNIESNKSNYGVLIHEPFFGI